MNPTRLPPFERDIAAQPEALRAFARADVIPALVELRLRSYERVVLTGMGSSHDAGLPTWRRLAGQGQAAWWVDTGQLLDTSGTAHRPDPAHRHLAVRGQRRGRLPAPVATAAG